ncbi:unnamed protein product, partial [Rotaria magnacalcarata]
MFNANNNTNFLTSIDNPFRSDGENPNDLLNDNTNMSTISLSSIEQLVGINFPGLMMFFCFVL